MKRHASNTPRIAAFATEPVTRRPLKVFLLESDIKLLVFVGKCMDYFGMGAVAGFLVGASAVYGYALFKELPYAGLFVPPKPAPQQFAQSALLMPPKQEKIKIRGVVTTDGTNAVKDAFQVGVVEVLSGEFTNGDGKFHLEVPRQETYKVAFWKPNYENLRVLELSLDETGTLSQAVWLPRDIALKGSPGSGPTNSRISTRGKGWRVPEILKVEDINRAPGIFAESHDRVSVEE